MGLDSTSAYSELYIMVLVSEGHGLREGGDKVRELVRVWVMDGTAFGFCPQPGIH